MPIDEETAEEQRVARFNYWVDVLAEEAARGSTGRVAAALKELDQLRPNKEFHHASK